MTNDDRSRALRGSACRDAPRYWTRSVRGCIPTRSVRNDQAHSFSLLIFIHASPYTAKRDLGAGRTQAAWSGQRGMDAALAAPGHGWPMAACPRSVACVREPDEVGPNREQMVLVTFPERKVTRRKGGTDISNTLNNGYTCNSGTPDPPHRSLPLVVSSYRDRVTRGKIGPPQITDILGPPDPPHRSLPLVVSSYMGLREPQ